MRIIVRTPISATILLVAICALAQKPMTETGAKPECGDASSEIIAAHLAHDIKLDAAHPVADWQKASPVSFCSDWQGGNPDQKRETQVRALWSGRILYLRFECRYRELYVFPDSEANGRRDHLWDRDVAEAFLQPDPTRPPYYKEFEVSPNGMWIDLDIFPGGLADLKSGLSHSIFLDEKSHTWAAELGIPIKSLTANFDPFAVWRANFLPHRRPTGAANLPGLAADRNSAAEFSCAQQIWQITLRARPLNAEKSCRGLSRPRTVVCIQIQNSWR